MNKFIYYYSKNIKRVTICTTSFSIYIGILNDKPINIPTVRLQNLIKFTIAGLITSITFPISFPIIGFIILIKNK
jgi:hypothetical protein